MVLGLVLIAREVVMIRIHIGKKGVSSSGTRREERS